MTRYAATVLWFALAAFAALHTRPGWGWSSVLVRVIMAADFLLAVGDRFGLSGPGAALV